VLDSVGPELQDADDDPERERLPLGPRVQYPGGVSQAGCVGLALPFGFLLLGRLLV
jgi:hypothetical protein